MKTRIVTARKEISVGGVIVPQGARYRAEYDYTKQTNKAGGRARRIAKVETGGEEQILPAFKRLQGTNLSRDMIRNNAQVHGIAKTLRNNVIGTEGKLRFNATGEWFAKAQRYFNSVWAKHADFIDGSTFRETLQLIVTTLAFDGDAVVVFDDGCISGEDFGSGKRLFFESDQITDLDKADWEEFVSAGHDGWTMESGIIRDRFGRKAGVIVSKTRGATSVPMKDALVLTCDPDDPDKAPWRHIVRKWRLRQLRGIPDSFATLQTVIDGYEMLGYELQSAKAQAAHYAAIIEPEDEPRETGTGFDDGEPTPEEEAEEAEEEEQTVEANGIAEYCAGGLVDVFPHGTQVSIDNPNRPNKDLPTFLDWTNDLAGMAHGLSHSFSRARADGSYTAYRGDVCQTALTFKDVQQVVEDIFSDWVAKKVLERAVALGILDTPPDGWEELIAWTYPAIAEVDETKAATARAQKYRNGELTLRDTLGPAWLDQIKQIAEEVRIMRSMGLHHPSEETISGQIVNGQTETDTEDHTEDED